MMIHDFSAKVLGSLWGSVTGDALGVPVEFRSRNVIRNNPVTGMRGFGTHNQPAGTWSDDSSLLLCSAESLVECSGFRATDMGERFVRWESDGHWTPHGRVFDIGIATSQALSRIAMGTPPELAGGADENSNGNGSLMRILPVALWYSTAPRETMLAAVQRASCITHRHLRSQMACGLYALFVRELLAGARPREGYRCAFTDFERAYTNPPFLAEHRHFEQLAPDLLANLPEHDIRSSGYVLHTLAASVWCLLTSCSFQETVLKAVNLGEDTDTTGCVAGGLAGMVYGSSAVPAEWLNTLARQTDLEELFRRFASALPKPA